MNEVLLLASNFLPNPTLKAKAWLGEARIHLRTDSTDSEMLSSPSESSKRSRLCCLVDGCNSDLSDCREYHRRHRVCEKHSKTPTVLVGGKQQRFCQQCSRFHSLGEFDEAKRSCRKRLDGHNRRRRKPQPPSLFVDAGKLLGNYKGPKILQFGGPQTYANPIMRNRWPFTAKTGAESMSYDHHRLLHKIDQHRHENGYKAGSGNEAMTETSICQSISGAIGPSGIEAMPGSFDSGCALYLLSTLQTPSSELSLEQSSITCPRQAPSGAVHFDAADTDSCSGRDKDKPTGPALVVDANTNNLHGPDGLLEENGDSLKLPFLWE